MKRYFLLIVILALFIPVHSKAQSNYRVYLPVIMAPLENAYAVFVQPQSPGDYGYLVECDGTLDANVGDYNLVVQSQDRKKVVVSCRSDLSHTGKNPVFPYNGLTNIDLNNWDRLTLRAATGTCIYPQPQDGKDRIVYSGFRC